MTSEECVKDLAYGCLTEYLFRVSNTMTDTAHLFHPHSSVFNIIKLNCVTAGILPGQGLALVTG